MNQAEKAAENFVDYRVLAVSLYESVIATLYTAEPERKTQALTVKRQNSWHYRRHVGVAAAYRSIDALKRMATSI